VSARRGGARRCSICQTAQEAAGQVRQAVIHEVAHHLGIDDRRLRELGW
jgi:predicted Zn-dependent protease with MMP-like domain